MKSIFIFLQLLYAQKSNEKQPNIIFVVADDLGWADVNWNNKEFSSKLSSDIKVQTFSLRPPVNSKNQLPRQDCGFDTHPWHLFLIQEKSLIFEDL